jgi:predicted regulator of Ras-like GTPase activity (Roadblock/LC7/MglB family)
VSLADLLAVLTRIPGVRGALIVSSEDGLAVADALMEGVDGRAVAALTGSLAARMRRVTGALGQPMPSLVHLQGTEGGFMAAYAPSGLLVVAVTDVDVNAGEVRLGLLSVAERVA